VPNKVYQGAAAGCALVTSDTQPQRVAFDGASVFVPPGDPAALAAALVALAEDPNRVAELAAAARARSLDAFTPELVVRPLRSRLRTEVRAEAQDQGTRAP
jgi:glycosyltransferase involved in cell wall biosynthesis